MMFKNSAIVLLLFFTFTSGVFAEVTKEDIEKALLKKLEHPYLIIY